MVFVIDGVGYSGTVVSYGIGYSSQFVASVVSVINIAVQSWSLLLMVLDIPVQSRPVIDGARYK
jgi:hypothetical protein